MGTQLLPRSAGVLAAVVLGLGSVLNCAAQGGHGGGGGHALGFGGFHGGFHGGCGPRGFCGYRGWYGGYPGWYGLGLGLGLGYGLGYGYGPGYGYGYGYPYGPYGGGYPVYVLPADVPPAPAAVPVCPVAAPVSAPATARGAAPVTPVRLTDSDVQLSVRVPADAVVRVNGVPTAQTGTRREFVSTGLAPGRTYPFVVTARWAGPDGQAVEMERRLHVQGGERRNVSFVVPPPPPGPLPPLERAGN